VRATGLPPAGFDLWRRGSLKVRKAINSRNAWRAAMPRGAHGLGLRPCRRNQLTGTLRTPLPAMKRHQTKAVYS
jgi:hypothetical protein